MRLNLMLPTYMKLPLPIALAALSCLFAGAALAQQPAAPMPPAISAEQREADMRVIAARCGTPAFEKSFYNDSRAAVAAGLVVRQRDPAEVEKRITALRRSPVVLVTAHADCKAQLEQLRQIQKERKGMRAGASAKAGGAR